MLLKNLTRVSAFALLAASSLHAQSLTTLFAGGNGLGAGAGVYFDLNVTSPTGITVLSMDVNVSSTVGTAGSVEIYTLPGQTYLGNEGAGAPPWNLATTGTLTAAGSGVPSAVTLASPLILPTGNHAIAICYLGVSPRYTNGNSTNIVYTTPDVSLMAGTSTPDCLMPGTVFNPRVWNGTLNYAVGTTGFATVNRFGAGCVEGYSSFYELFTTASPFDFAGTAGAEYVLQGFPTNNGFVVLQGASNFFPPTPAGDLALPNTGLSPTLALPFPFPLPDGTQANSIVVSSEGYVALGGNPTSPDISESVAELVDQFPRFALLWDSLNPSAAGASVHFDVDPSGNAVYVSFVAVPESTTVGANTAQLMLRADGSFEMRCGDCSLQDCLVGFSPGGMALIPRATDLSNAPFVRTRPDSLPLNLSVDARPLLGTTVNLVTSNIPLNTTLGGLVLGFQQIVPGVMIGQTGCIASIAGGSSLTFVPTGSSFNVPLPIPNNSNLAGIRLNAQSLTFSTGFNPLGILTSNGIELLINPN